MAEELSETDQIERDLARTRARMDRRLDELQEKMTPAQLVNEVFSHVRGGDGGEFAADLITRAKANPIAVALTGVGIAWLMLGNRQSDPSPRFVDHGDNLEARIRDAEGQVHRSDGEPDDAFSARLADAHGKVLGLVREVSETSSDYADRVGEALARAKQAARELTHDVKNSARGALASFSSTGRRQSLEGSMSTGSSRLGGITSNPLALGAIAAVVGIVAGTLLPATDEEERLLGPAAGKLKTAGRDLAQDLVDRGGRVVNQALDTARDSAERAGLSTDKPIGEAVAALRSGELASSVKQVASDVVEAGKAAAQSEMQSGPTDRP
jgi:hypothetical protein